MESLEKTKNALKNLYDQMFEKSRKDAFELVSSGFEELVAEKNIEIERLKARLDKYETKCEVCGGDGLVDDIPGSMRINVDMTKPCPSCNGSGVKPVVRVEDWFVHQAFYHRWQWASQIDEKDPTRNYKYNIYDPSIGGRDNPHLIATVTRDPDDPGWWIVEAME